MTFDSITFWVLIIIFVSTFIRSAFGFGDAVIAMPLLALMMPIRTATPLVALIAITIAMIILIGHWRMVRVRSAWRLIVATLAGIPLGLLLLRGLYEHGLKMILGLLIIGFSLYQFIKPGRVVITGDRSAYPFGFLAGILGGAYNTNGPLIVIYGSLKQWSPETFRATLQGYFFTTGLLILMGHATAGLWTRTVFRYYLLALPIVFLAIWMGGRVHRIVARGKFDRYIYMLLMLLGMFLFVQTLYLHLHG